MKSFPRNVTTILVTAVTVATLGCGHGDAERAEPSLNPLAVRIQPVERIGISRPIEVRGIVQPVREAFVSSRVMGPVVAIHVDAGARVSKGQPMLEIEPETSEGQLAQAQGALSQARAALALAETNFRRFENLHSSGAASDLELDMARMQHDQANGAVTQAEGAVLAASAVAGESVVRAPFDARVVDTLVEVGDQAAPGRPLVRVESARARQIWLTVRESDIGRVEAGGRVVVRLDSRPDLGTLDGSVDEIVPSADPATHTFTIKVGLPELPLASGLSGRAELAGDTTEMLVVPGAAVHRRGGLELVVVRAQDGTARTRAVTTGRAVDGNRIEILSGLDEGDSIVIDAPAPVPDGTPLEVGS